MEKINNLIGLVVCLSCFVIGAVHAETAERIDSAKAPFYVGKTVMVCGVIKEVVPRSKNVYLNMTRNYPREDLALVVWREDFGLFSLITKSKYSPVNSYIIRYGEAILR